MKNYIRHGDTLPLTAPAGGVVSGNAYLIGIIFGVAAITAAAGESFELRRKGVVYLPKKTGEAWTEGAALYWDNTAKVLTTTANGNTLVAAAAEGVVNSEAFGSAVMLPAA